MLSTIAILSYLAPDSKPRVTRASVIETLSFIVLASKPKKVNDSSTEIESLISIPTDVTLATSSVIDIVSVTVAAR